MLACQENLRKNQHPYLLRVPARKMIILKQYFSLQAKNYIKQLPKWEKKDFRQVFKGANPKGMSVR